MPLPSSSSSSLSLGLAPRDRRRVRRAAFALALAFALVASLVVVGAGLGLGVGGGMLSRVRWVGAGAGAGAVGVASVVRSHKTASLDDESAAAETTTTTTTTTTTGSRLVNVNDDDTGKRNEAWARAALFHVVDERTVAGAFAVRRPRARGGWWDTTNATEWGGAETGPCPRYNDVGDIVAKRLRCALCVRGGGPCVAQDGRLVIHARVRDDAIPLYEAAFPMAKQRSYVRRDLREFRAKFKAAYAKCVFEEAISSTESWGGAAMAELRLIDSFAAAPAPAAGVDSGAPRIAALFDVSLSFFAKPERGDPEDVVCSRGLFGPVDPSALMRFVTHHVGRWGFRRVILYQIGLDFAPFRIEPLAELVRTGVVVVVDARSVLQRLYGSLAVDVAMFSVSTLQMVLRGDCVARAMAMRARWTLLFDVDELLFVGRDAPLLSSSSSSASDGASFAEWVATHGSKENPPRWVSFAKVGVSARSACACWPRSQRLVGGDDDNEFWRLARAEHEAEWAAASARGFGSLPGPFFHRDNRTHAQYGRAKIAIRLDDPDSRIDLFGVELHRVFPCWRGTRTHSSSLGSHLNPTTGLYIREYRCLNEALGCGRNTTQPHARWFLSWVS